MQDDFILKDLFPKNPFSLYYFIKEKKINLQDEILEPFVKIEALKYINEISSLEQKEKKKILKRG